jgi:photosystem II stability/assembly factor-like uncharacterized protein
MKNLFTILVMLISSFAYSQSAWFFQNSGHNRTGALTDVYFINQNTGWLCGQYEMISKTTNGGTNWIPLQNAGYHHYSIYFLNEYTGWVTTTVSGSYVVLKTTNSGINWMTLNIPNQYPNDVYFINENTGWISSNDNNMLKTTNGGLNWSSFTLSGNIPYGLYSISFVNSQTGWCIGHYYNSYTYEQYFSVIKTTNGGNTWFIIREESHEPYRNYRDIQFLDSQTGYLNRIPPSKTTDGGQTWFNILDSTYYKGMHFIDINTGWFAGWGGILTKTTNGGLNWQTQVITNSFIAQEIYFIDLNTGWVVGGSYISQNIIMKTTTGGITFVNTNSNYIPDKYFLFQNYPNPFNPATNIKFAIPKNEFVKITVFDMLGKELETLVNEQLQSGTYETNWNASNYPSGVYFYKLSAGDFSETKMMLLIK